METTEAMNTVTTAGSSASLKAKLLQLENLMNTITEEINFQK